jgi:CheY-like chemotaxis protein
MTKQKVLIVEDEPVNRFILNVHLSQTNMEVIEAVNGKQALNILNTHADIRVVLLDLNMPVLDGYQFLNSFSNCPKNARRPLSVIIVSSNAEASFLSMVEKKGVNTSRVTGYMRKPVQINILLDLIDKAIELAV